MRALRSGTKHSNANLFKANGNSVPASGAKMGPAVRFCSVPFFGTAYEIPFNPPSGRMRYVP
jgi:hypothetical protein